MWSACKSKLLSFKNTSLYVSCDKKMVKKWGFVSCIFLYQTRHVTYSTIWTFIDIIPDVSCNLFHHLEFHWHYTIFCEIMSSHFNTSLPIQEETFTNQCQISIIHRSVKFTFSMLAVTVYTSLYFSTQFLKSYKDQNIT